MKQRDEPGFVLRQTSSTQRALCLRHPATVSFGSEVKVWLLQACDVVTTLLSS